MSQREKRGRGRPKRARVEGESSRDKPTTPAFAPSNYGTHSSASYTDSSANQASPTFGSDSRSILQSPPGFKTEQGIAPHPPLGKVAIPSLRHSQDTESTRR